MDTKTSNPSFSGQALTGGSEPVTSEFFERFLIVKSEGERLLSNQSPFLVQRLFSTFTGLKSIKKLRNKDFLMEVESANLSGKMLKLDKIGKFKVKVEPHKSLNHVKGVVFHPDLGNCEEQEIVENLKAFGVTEAFCATKTVNGNKRRSGLVILTFKRQRVPDSVYAGYLRLKVRPYIPNPMRCYKCQKFGHISHGCRVKNTVCGNCGQHCKQDEPCQNPSKCVNCGESHPSNSRDCSNWKMEKEIQKVKVEREITYYEAKKLYELQSAQDRPYSVVAKTPQMVGGDAFGAIVQRLDNLEKMLSTILSERVQKEPNKDQQQKPLTREEKVESMTPENLAQAMGGVEITKKTEEERKKKETTKKTEEERKKKETKKSEKVDTSEIVDVLVMKDKESRELSLDEKLELQAKKLSQPLKLGMNDPIVPETLDLMVKAIDSMKDDMRHLKTEKMEEERKEKPEKKPEKTENRKGVADAEKKENPNKRRHSESPVDKSMGAIPKLSKIPARNGGNLGKQKTGVKGTPTKKR